jgi:hypothetical protein
MLCVEFEDRLTDYLESALPPAEHIAFAEHALRCPVCHQVLNEVKAALQMCHESDVPVPPSVEMEANILRQTAPEALMACAEFEEHLTDYLDGFLPASLYHRWERHAAVCARCTDLPGQVVRSIGACYSYINEELPVPEGLHESILQATLGTSQAAAVRAPWRARAAEWLRGWLDPIVTPQLATVATMLLLAVLVLTNTVSKDGSITGMYQASVQLAERTYEHGTGLNRGVGLEDWKKLQQIQAVIAPEEKKDGPQKQPEQKDNQQK